MRRDDFVSLGAVVVLGSAAAIAVGVANQFAQLLIAYATAAVAVFSWGTWKIYQFEKEKTEAVPEKVASRMVRIGLDYHEAAEFANAAPEDLDFVSNKILLELVHERVKLASQHLWELLDEVAIISEETTAVVGAAETNSLRILSFLEALKTSPPGSDGYDSLFEQAQSALRGTARELIKAGRELPGSGLGSRGRDFSREITLVSNRIMDTNPAEDLMEALHRSSDEE